ncbi:MAG: hypothetical protein ABF636_13665 [Acetobacter sp.]|jgi:hypothetical protein|uniref:DUF2384 domain-containing protein n=1 Tax=Acetobacter lovaniensis TaxID=104100 RepID=A0A841QLP2_9PROT|nr:hypothetical protein [Acetobacter lovaniensis]MBB6458827.1 hypothetical protein [Acetobacter lovaniensis]MCP1240961.1 hypothetical protein [Acetobacter lovaniensis]NHN83004.1 hypothetical protein [Acetobacter lovaniensis]GBQ66675.1 hypothetical protein AA0474_1186 [Acetobacter lovaniensis NRIC 0474]
MASHELSGLIRYLGQDDWGACFDEVLEQHLGPALDAAEVSFDDLKEIIGPDVAMTLWGCAFEDFLGQDRDDGRNIVDIYLKRRGWKEGPRNSAYMRALRASVMSLYEVSDIRPGQSFMARDLLRGGEPVLVHEGTATRTPRQWDRIAARLVPSDGKTILAGGLLACSREACEDLAANLYRALRKRRGKAEFPKVDTETLRELAPMFTLTWLFRTLETLARQMEGAPQLLFNSDGDELLFHEIRYPLAKGVTQKTVAAALDAVPDLRPESRTFWNWLENHEAPKKAFRPQGRAKAGLSLTSEMDDGATVLGTLELRGRQLLVGINSRERTARGQAMLAEVLGSLVGTPLTQIMTPGQTMAEQESRSGLRDEGSLSIPPEEEARLIGEVMDRHYRQVLDEAVPALGDLTPRQAARTAAGRQKLIVWLKHLENNAARSGDAQRGIAAYDFTWMWVELGVAQFRK